MKWAFAAMLSPFSFFYRKAMTVALELPLMWGSWELTRHGTSHFLEDPQKISLPSTASYWLTLPMNLIPSQVLFSVPFCKILCLGADLWQQGFLCSTGTRLNYLYMNFYGSIAAVLGTTCIDNEFLDIRTDLDTYNGTSLELTDSTVNTFGVSFAIASQKVTWHSAPIHMHQVLHYPHCMMAYQCCLMFPLSFDVYLGIPVVFLVNWFASFNGIKIFAVCSQFTLVF